MIVEIVTKSGRVMEVHSFQKDQITIGRGYGNDLILQDPYMEANHLAASYDSEIGQISVRDLGSLNGTKIHGLLTTLEGHVSTQLQARQILTLGKTNIRILDREHSIPSALKLSSFEPLFAYLGSWWVSLLAIVAAVVLTLVSAYLENPFSDKLVKELNAVVMYVVVAICYGGLWVMLARLQRIEGRFLLNMNMLLLILVMDELVQLSLSVYDFNLGWLLSTGFFSISISFGLVYMAVSVSCSQTMHLRKWMTAAVASTIGFLPIMSEVSAVVFPPDFTSNPGYNMTLVAPAYQVRGASSEEEFLRLVNDAYQSNEKDEVL
ncbi:FHA domain-containing protein [Teredinibacter haidensis]|uniref:FHA domain-containing protein n=1 Tax=Teredinibacter haidensis TaxID=2731755 RepID=UPI000948D8C8|nr:FHA domain-containing protein [Teredinibacter haidensis]